MELTDEAKAEIKAAIDILKSDGIHIHKTYKSFMATQEPPKNDPPKNDPPKDPTGGPPPKTDPPADPPVDPPKRRGIWWGDKE